MVRLDLLMTGPVKDIYSLVDHDRSDTNDYLGGLPASAQKKLYYTFSRLTQTGWAGHDESIVRHLDGKVYEIKEHSSNSRLFCFFWGLRIIVCTHAGRKPAGKNRYRIEIAKVERLLDACLREGVL
jgi:phage-related protein